MPKYNNPSEFNFERPGEWPEWKQRFMRYRICEKLNKEDGEIQVNSLVYSMGREAEKIFGSFALTAAQQKEFDVVVKKFDDYFIPQHTVMSVPSFASVIKSLVSQLRLSIGICWNCQTIVALRINKRKLDASHWYEGQGLIYGATEKPI